MDKENLASKIKALRKRRGFSQEQLAEESTLSLRTVQRIENGETVPHGDSLIKLTQALSVNPDDILEWAPIEDKGYLTLLNLSGLGFIFHPLLGVIIPLVMWTLKKDKIKAVNDTGKKLINFEITFTILLYSFLLIFSKGIFYFLHLLTAPVGIFTFLINVFSPIGLLFTLLYLYNICFIVINVKRSKKGLKSKYVPAIPFLR